MLGITDWCNEYLVTTCNLDKYTGNSFSVHVLVLDQN